MGKIENYLEEGVGKGASDIHLVSGNPVMFRVDGALVPASEEKLQEKEVEEILQELLDGERKEELRQRGILDAACTVAGSFRIRLHAFRQRGSYAIVVRILSMKAPDVKSLGIPASVLKLTERKSGLVLAAGAAGSGRTTTLAAVIQQIADTSSRTVITLESPAEYLYSSGKSMVVQQEIGKDCGTYADGLRAALRGDADVILVGKLQDTETIELAITAAELGHLVFAETDTDSVVTAVERMIDGFPLQQQQRIRRQLSDVLKGIVIQQLVPLEGGGRAAAYEVLLADQAVRNLIREDRCLQLASVMKNSRASGMQMMDDAIYELYMKSLITLENAVAFAKDTEAMQQKVKLF